MQTDIVISRMTNAIGFEVFKGDGRPVTKTKSGVDCIEVSEEETAVARVAAERVQREMIAEGWLTVAE